MLKEPEWLQNGGGGKRGTSDSVNAAQAEHWIPHTWGRLTAAASKTSGAELKSGCLVQQWHEALHTESSQAICLW